MIRAIIFDFDGVILDSVPIKTRAFAALFSKYGPEAEAHIVEYHLAHGGISRYRKFEWFYREVLQKEATPDDLQKLGRKFEELVYQAVLNAEQIPGALEFLRENHQSYKMFVASGTPHAEIADIVEKRNLGPYFLEVHGSPATKTEIIQKILDVHALKSEETVFIGDAMTDYRAAQDCHLPFIGIAFDLKNPFPPGTCVIQNLQDLQKTLLRLA